MKKLLFVASILFAAMVGITAAPSLSYTAQFSDTDTLRLEGPEKTFSKHTESTSENLVKEPPMMHAKYGLSSKGILTINATEPLVKITVKDHEAEVVKSYELHGEKDVEFDLNTMPTGHLDFILKGQNGAENILQVEN